MRYKVRYENAVADQSQTFLNARGSLKRHQLEPKPRTLNWWNQRKETETRRETRGTTAAARDNRGTK